VQVQVPSLLHLPGQLPAPEQLVLAFVGSATHMWPSHFSQGLVQGLVVEHLHVSRSMSTYAHAWWRYLG
jgi:hypothetical protein